MGAIAAEALATAGTLSPGPTRDAVLQAVSRNLRWFGFPEQGIAAAQAMTGEARAAELRAATVRTRPRFLTLDEAMNPADPCLSTEWIIGGPGGPAGETATIDARVQECILSRDTHWSGPPPRERLDRVYAALPRGETKARLLHYLVLHFQEPATVRWAERERGALEPLMPAEERASFLTFMARPEALYWRGERERAIAAARRTTEAYEIGSLIVLLVHGGDAATAVRLLPVLDKTATGFSVGECDDWFGVAGSLQNLQHAPNTEKARTGLVTFLDLLPRSPTFRARCSAGLPDEVALALLHRAGRTEEAIAREAASGDRTRLADFLEGLGSEAYFDGKLDVARAYWVRGSEVFPPFPKAGLPEWNLASRVGINLVEALSAVGEVERARKLAFSFPNRAWRALALSAVVAGRGGLSRGFDAIRAEQVSPEQVPMMPDA